MIQLDHGRFSAHRRNLYDRHWNLLPVRLKHAGIAQPQPKPPHLAEIIAAAERLGAGQDFLRIDFYDTPARCFFGEITATPGAGLEPFYPASYDAHLGALWQPVTEPVAPAEYDERKAA